MVTAMGRFGRASMVREGGCRGAVNGQAAVEFALTSLLLLTLFFGTIDLGRAVFTRTMLTNAVREATRQATITPNDPTAIKNAADIRSPTLNLASSAFVVDCDTWANSITRSCNPTSTNPLGVRSQDRVRVCTDYPFSLIATKLIERATFTFRECEQASVQ